MTLQDLFKYPNAKIKTANGEIITVLEFIIQAFGHDNVNYDLPSCQLILKSLSDITEEDAISIAKAATQLEFFLHSKSVGKHLLLMNPSHDSEISMCKIYFSYGGNDAFVDVFKENGEHTNFDIVAATDKARELGYDIDNLQEAINEKEL